MLYAYSYEKLMCKVNNNGEYSTESARNVINMSSALAAFVDYKEYAGDIE